MATASAGWARLSGPTATATSSFEWWPRISTPGRPRLGTSPAPCCTPSAARSAGHVAGPTSDDRLRRGGAGEPAVLASPRHRSRRPVAVVADFVVNPRRAARLGRTVLTASRSGSPGRLKARRSGHTLMGGAGMSSSVPAPLGVGAPTKWGRQRATPAPPIAGTDRTEAPSSALNRVTRRSPPEIRPLRSNPVGADVGCHVSGSRRAGLLSATCVTALMASSTSSSVSPSSDWRVARMCRSGTFML